MKKIVTFITEKLKINKNIKVLKQFNIDDDSCEIDLIIAAVISIINNQSYTESYDYKKEIKSIKHKDLVNIIDVLNNHFNYAINYNEARVNKGIIWKYITDLKTDIQNLINGFTLYYKNNSVCDTLSLKDIKEKYGKLFKDK